MYKIKKEKLIQFYNSANLLQVINLAPFGAERVVPNSAAAEALRRQMAQEPTGKRQPACALRRPWGHTHAKSPPRCSHFLHLAACDSVSFLREAVEAHGLCFEFTTAGV